MMPPPLLHLSFSLLSAQGPQEAADRVLGQQDAFQIRSQASICFLPCLPKWPPLPYLPESEQAAAELGSACTLRPVG